MSLTCHRARFHWQNSTDIWKFKTIYPNPTLGWLDIFLQNLLLQRKDNCCFYFFMLCQTTVRWVGSGSELGVWKTTPRSLQNLRSLQCMRWVPGWKKCQRQNQEANCSHLLTFKGPSTAHIFDQQKTPRTLHEGMKLACKGVPYIVKL